MEKNKKAALTLALTYLTKVRMELECTKDNELTVLNNKPLKEEKNKKHL